LYFSTRGHDRHDFLLTLNLMFNNLFFTHLHELTALAGILSGMSEVLHYNALTLAKKLTMIRQVWGILGHPMKPFLVPDRIIPHRHVTNKQEQTCIRTRFC
jgi:hypothetical protein